MFDSGNTFNTKKLLKCSFLNLVSARCSGPGSGRNIPCRTNALVFMPMTGAVRTFSAAPVFRAFRRFRRYSALMRLAGHDNHSAAGRCDLKSFLSLKKQGCRRHPRPPQSGVQHDAAGRMNFIQPVVSTKILPPARYSSMNRASSSHAESPSNPPLART